MHFAIDNDDNCDRIIVAKRNRKEMRIMINSQKLKGLMREKNVTQRDLADILGITQATCCLKINNNRQLTLNEANKIAETLGISALDFGAYFFA